MSKAAGGGDFGSSAGAPSSTVPAQAVEQFEELLRPQRLGDVGVHAGLQATFPVALEGVGGHGDDRGMGAVAASRARIAAVASKPSISGICTSISTRSNGPSSSAATASRRCPPPRRGGPVSPAG